MNLSSISLENFKDLSLINPEILELIELHTYKFGLVFIQNAVKFVFFKFCIEIGSALQS